MNPFFTYEQHFLANAFEDYLKNTRVDSDELSSFFDGFVLGCQNGDQTLAPLIEAKRLLQYYRHFGYLSAQDNPLKVKQASPLFNSKLEEDTLVPSLGLFEDEFVTLKSFKDRLHSIYCSQIGYEFLHCDKEVIDFITHELEQVQSPPTHAEKLQSYALLSQVCLFETFLHTRFPGQKRFSIEGLETAIVLIQEIISCVKDGVKDIFFGMAHRGRLNLLANILHKPLEDIFREFSKNASFDESYLGDVKYHQGASHTTNEGLNLTLSSNPSHLEAVGPVVLGMSYAKQKISKTKALTFMIHGDASFAGQGVVYETMQMSKIKDFDAGGVMHIILNNQIGFTASPEESRSTPNATDLAKSFNCPIFHVNSENVDALIKLADLATRLHQKFGCDVMIDIIGYRKWGHNESDEPSFTQPLLYQSLKEKKSPLELYKQELIQNGAFDKTELEAIDSKFQKLLQDKFQSPPAPSVSIAKSHPSQAVNIDAQKLKSLGESITNLPKEFQFHPKLIKLYQERHTAIKEHSSIDFALAELLALGYVLKSDHSIRFVGQDSCRGTFSQRHAVLIDQANESRYLVLSPLLKEDIFCQIVNSPLSEYAVLGFEYGFSKVAKNCLTIWEAQFGDFANGAQIIIDQFIASGRTKWNDQSNLTLLLPHGYEGQGPEHSSARIERFLELGAGDNMKVIIPSSPKQYFKALVDQSIASSPLVVFTPKALLRYPACKSSFDELCTQPFQTFIDDHNELATVTVLCYGKIYYDLLSVKESKHLNHISLVRLEQLYPFDKTQFEHIISKKAHQKRLVLVQDEPFNMGAAIYLKSFIPHLEVISRPLASSPATGSVLLHETQLTNILKQFESL